MIQVKRLTETAVLPTKAYPEDAGWDLYMDCIPDIDGCIWIQPGERVLIRTGCAFAIPSGYYGRIADRSGNAWKFGLHVLGGVVDSMYRGEVMVILLNTSSTEYCVKVGDKIAQMIITRISRKPMVEVDVFREDIIDNTKNNSENNGKHNNQRGASGFGSSGK